ncbi:MAG: hypothetical protein U1D35_13195, partial [Paracoccaceae bacterium]|nr:hypothetical protein [Paracoccaceae bacterium]
PHRVCGQQSLRLQRGAAKFMRRIITGMSKALWAALLDSLPTSAQRNTKPSRKDPAWLMIA